MENRKNTFQRRREPAAIEVPEGQVRVLESHHAKDFQMPLSVWPFHKIGWVAVGRGTLEHVDGSCPISANDFLLLPADWPHRFIDDVNEPLTLVVLCVSGNYLKERSNPQLFELWEAALGRNPLGTPVRAKTAFHRSALIEGFRLALREQGNRNPGWETALETVANRMVLSFARSHCEPSEIHEESSLRAVEGAIEYVDTHVQENLRIEDMAARSHLSPRRFTDLFKQQTGETFSQYLNRKRIEYACRRLDETGHITYACHGAGFNDLAYFYRVFKKHTGLTPGEYLKQ